MEILTRDILDVAESSDNSLLTFSVASDNPCTRFSEKLGEYDEILIISEEAINWARLSTGSMAFLLDHKADKQVGAVKESYIRGNKLYVSVEFSSAEWVKQLVKDIEAGVKTNTSIGYSVDDATIEMRNGRKTKIVTRWTPVECSLVSIPADETVGFNRSMETSQEEQPAAEERAADTIEENVEMNKEVLENKETEVKEVREEVRSDADEIRALGELCDQTELADEFIKNERTLEDFKKEILTRKSSKKDTSMDNTKQRFSLKKAILNKAGALDDESASYERGIIAQNMRDLHEHGADIVLTNKQVRDMFDGVTDAALNQVQYRPELYANVLPKPNAVSEAGVRNVTVNGRSISFAVATSGMTAAYGNLNTAVASAAMAFDLKEMTPHKCGAYTTVSYESLMQDAPEVEGIILEDIIRALDEATDRAFFQGLSGNQEPQGLLNYPGVNEVNHVAPSAVTIDLALEFEKKIRESGDYSGDLKWFMGTTAYYQWKAQPKKSTCVNEFMIDDDDRCLGYKVFCTPALPASGVVLGNFNECLQAQFDGITLKLAEDFGLASKQAVAIIAHRANDFCFRRAKSFSKLV